MGREPVDKHMDNKPNSLTTSSTGSSDNNKVQGQTTIEAAEVKECTKQNLVANDAHQRQQVLHTNVEGINDSPGFHKSSDNKKKLNASSLKTRGSANYTVPKPFSLSAEKPASSNSGRARADNTSSVNAISHNSSSGSRGSQPNSPLPARKTIDHKKHHDEDDNFSVASSSATSVRTTKPKITIGVAPTFRSTSRLERRKEFYQKLEEKQKALEEEKRENEKRLKEEQEVVTKQLRKNMAYKANPVPNFYYEAPPPKLPLKKFPLTRPKSPNLNRRKSCSDTVNSSNQEVKGKHCVRHRHSVDGCKEDSKTNNSPRTPNMRKSTKETPKSEELHGMNKSGRDGERSKSGIDVVE
ncbi:hypothetical protein EUTSA_v10023556mg [Eutrema salsugineum]|uniref:TPX2 C-terminal domain-containing protein n=1 Tax=Eutrema salsugineum TaxID=72664 RepID=V4KR30_EUTSA|nr:protein WVD2-like 2 [Eutrema salsugineum]XP_024005321.1 protein WVD2-like 2 [Eutrema salsugineum]ESQ29818.1 hypothetical protein EUTSA_v10023556mg [Eutrema salsugineum]